MVLDHVVKLVNLFAPKVSVLIPVHHACRGEHFIHGIFVWVVAVSPKIYLKFA
jgi:hypothetical protein